MSTYDYDLLIIGCGPAGQRAAVQAAKLRKKVAIIDKRTVVGGNSLNTGTIPSKSFREAVLYLSGHRHRYIYGSGYRVKSEIEMSDLTFRCSKTIQIEIDVIKDQLQRNHVDYISGFASFVDEHTLQITEHNGNIYNKTAKFCLIATGAAPFHPPNILFDNKYIFDSDDILTMQELPRSLTVVGGGVIGVEYATMFAALGVDVTIVDGRTKLLEFLDQEIVECLQYQMRSLGVTLRLGEEVDTCSVRDDGQVITKLKSGKVIVSDKVFVSAGRRSSIEGLGLEKLDLELGERGKVIVNNNFQTKYENIYGAGDVIGFPALAATSAAQGRLVSAHAFGISDETSDAALPFGIYAIPEISYVGETEESLTKKNIPYETGIARYREIVRGQILGDINGMLKVIFHRQTYEILGVHIIGESATELIHIGQAAMNIPSGLKYLRDAVFNYPTLAEAYKVAAYDGYNKSRAYS